MPPLPGVAVAVGITVAVAVGTTVGLAVGGLVGIEVDVGLTVVVGKA